MSNIDDRGQPVPLEDVAAGIERAFAEAAGHGTKSERTVTLETARLMDEAFGRAEAVACSPNVLPFVRRAAQRS